MIEVAQEYIKRGWRPIPIPDGSKSPTDDAWQKLEITAETVSRHFHSGPQNVGVQLGPKSNGLTDVDLDCREAVALAPHFLPETGAIFGRKSKPKSHYLYYISDPEPKASINLKSEAKETIIEIRLGGGGKAAQTVFPPSRHESGEQVTWVQSGEPAKTSFATIHSAVIKIAVGSLLARHWPRKGGRHDAALRVGGFLARVGWDPETIDTFVFAIARAVDDDEVDDRRKAAADAVAAFGRGEKVYGLPALGECFGESVAKQIAKFLEYRESDHDSLLEEMNGKYCVVPFGGKAGILTFERNLGRPLPVFYSASDFRLLLDNKKVVAKVGRGSWWLNHAERRQYEGVAFRPGQPISIDGYLNLWRGWGVAPEPGQWPLMKKHIKEVLADGDPKHAEYIMRWAAWALQNPGRVAEVALVFRGGRGVGKGFFGRAMCQIVGVHGLQFSDVNQITGRFNAHLMNCVVMFADEAFWPGDKSAEGTLKRIITEPTLTIEKKRHDTIQVDNCLHVIMAANNEWVIPAGLDERRFAVFDVSPKHQQQEKYFAALNAEIEAGGLAAMMHDLQRLDLTGWHPRKGVPQTKALLDQKMRTLNPEDQWWLGLLREGYLPAIIVRSNRYNRNTNPRRAQSVALFEHARTTVPKLKFASDHVLGGALRERGCRSVEVERRAGWEFPPLTEARREWETKLRAKMVWPRPDAEDWGEVPM